MTLIEAPIVGTDDAVIGGEGPGVRSLGDRVAETVGVLNAVTAQLVGLIGEVLSTDAWAGFGIRSPEHWVTWRCGVSPERARRLVALARGMDELPETTGLFGAGSLTEDQMSVIARHADTAHDAQVAEFATSMTVPQLRRVLPTIPRGKPADGPDDGNGGDGGDGDGGGRGRGVRFGFDERGNWWCHARLAPDQGALVQRALEASRDHEFRLRHPNHDDDGDGDPNSVTWTDGLLRLADAGLDVLDANTAAGRSPDERTQVILHLDADAQVPPRLHLGPIVPPQIADLLSCDATARWVLWRNGNPAAMGRRERTVNPRLRALIEQRDGGCRVPGCDYSRWLHVHHIRHWTNGGATDPENLCCLCRVHHRMVHHGQLTITGDPTTPTGLVFTDNHGRTLQPAHPRPPNSDWQPADHNWNHPEGTPFYGRWFAWN